MGAHKNENMLVGKLQKKTPVGRPEHICGKKDKKKIKWLSREFTVDAVITAKNFKFHSKWKFLINWTTIKIWGFQAMILRILISWDVTCAAGNLTNPVVLRNAVPSSSRVSKS